MRAFLSDIYEAMLPSGPGGQIVTEFNHLDCRLAVQSSEGYWNIRVQGPLQQTGRKGYRLSEDVPSNMFIQI